MSTSTRRKFRIPHWAGFALEFLLIILVAYFYCGELLLNLDATKLQQTGEHNEISTLPLLAEIGLRRYGEFPLWNPYALTGYPYAAGDLVSFFWNPVSTIPVMAFGGLNGMKVSAFLCFIFAGLGQWMFGYVIGLRRTFRLWSAILFMISGGIALLWRVGWYGLLVGIAWFPWCFAMLLRALQKKTLPWIIATSLAVFMVLSAGGGYYPVYLFVSMATLTILFIIRAKQGQRWRVIRAAALVVVFSAALSAIVLVPYIDGFRYTTRDAPIDIYQYYSQPIQYGLLNYIIHSPEWFREDVLGTASGWNWFYIGWLPVAALALVPLAYSRSRRQRWPILLNGILLLVLMMWFANRYTPLKLIYEWLPILYNYRFPNRLLILAASPLLILAAQGLEYVYRLSKVTVKRRNKPSIKSAQGSIPAPENGDSNKSRTGSKNLSGIFTHSQRPRWREASSSVFRIKTKFNFKFISRFVNKILGFLPAHRLLSLYWILALALTAKTVFDVNSYFAFIDQDLSTESFSVLNWLNNFDTSLYYINLGEGDIYWNWTPAAYSFEMPVINFQYNHRLRSQDEQRADGSPFIAKEKYLILSVYKKPHLENAKLLRRSIGVNVYYNPDALPYAFSVQPTLLHGTDKLTPEQVTAMDVRLLGPNRVVVKGQPTENGDVLVVLMSDYPGWKLLIDGNPAPVATANGYLGSILQPGEHIYTFYFQPNQHLIGAFISNITLAFVAIYLSYIAIKKFGIDKKHKLQSPI